MTLEENRDVCARFFFCGALGSEIGSLSRAGWMVSSVKWLWWSPCAIGIPLIAVAAFGSSVRPISSGFRAPVSVYRHRHPRPCGSENAESDKRLDLTKLRDNESLAGNHGNRGLKLHPEETNEEHRYDARTIVLAPKRKLTKFLGDWTPVAHELPFNTARPESEFLSAKYFGVKPLNP